MIKQKCVIVARISKNNKKQNSLKTESYMRRNLIYNKGGPTKQ